MQFLSQILTFVTFCDGSLRLDGAVLQCLQSPARTRWLGWAAAATGGSLALPYIATQFTALHNHLPLPLYVRSPPPRGAHHSPPSPPCHGPCIQACRAKGGGRRGRHSRRVAPIRLLLVRCMFPLQQTRPPPPSPPHLCFHFKGKGGGVRHKT